MRFGDGDEGVHSRSGGFGGLEGGGELAVLGFWDAVGVGKGCLKDMLSVNLARRLVSGLGDKGMVE